MSDPLSIAAGIIGLLSATVQVSVILKDVISRARDAPQTCRRTQSEVEEIRNILGQLQVFLSGGKQAMRSRQALIMIDQVTATLASCITTFDGLKLLVEGIKTDLGMGILDKARWLYKTPELEDFQRRLETHKSSLTLMLIILTCQKQDDAEDNVNALRDMVDKIYAMNVMIAQRMAAWDMSQVGNSGTGTQDGLVNATQNWTHSDPPDNMTDVIPDDLKRDHRGFAFEELLNNSRAYKQAARNNIDAFSVVSAAGRTATWSMLSGLSLGEISNIAILAIPVYATDLNDKEAYDFDVPTKYAAGNEFFHDHIVPPSETTKTKRSFKNVFKRSPKQSDPAIVEPPTAAVFAVSLGTSVLYANVAISLTNEAGEMFIYGYVPIVVAKCGVYLKEKESATDVENIFATGGHAARIAALRKAFDSPPRYGKGLDWTGFTIHDAASLLLRYLKSLPEPLVPYDSYDKFTATVANIDIDMINDGQLPEAEYTGIIRSLQRQITELPPLNRQLLLYILDLLAVFANKSDLNRMTAARLVAVFQPTFLSKRPNEMGSEDHLLAANIAIFLVEKQDNFLIGMAGTEGTS